MLESVAATLGVSSSMLLERPLEQSITFAVENEFRAFEVWADHPHAHPDETPPEMRRRIRTALRPFERVSAELTAIRGRTTNSG